MTLAGSWQGSGQLRRVKHRDLERPGCPLIVLVRTTDRVLGQCTAWLRRLSRQSKRQTESWLLSPAALPGCSMLSANRPQRPNLAFFISAKAEPKVRSPEVGRQDCNACRCLQMLADACRPGSGTVLPSKCPRSCFRRCLCTGADELTWRPEFAKHAS